jgi:PAS domain S-box-containing protein
MRKVRKRSPRQAKPMTSDVDAQVARLEAQRARLEAQNEALREAHHEAEVSRDRYAELFDFAPIGYVSIDRKGIVLDLNFAAADMLGAPRMSIVGFSLVNFVDVPHRDRYWAHLAQCRSSTSPVKTELDLRVKPLSRTAVEVMPVQLVSAPSLATDRPTMVHTAIIDLRARRLAEQRAAELIRESAMREDAERASKAKDDFFALLAHELRTPLNAIHGWTHLLASGKLGEAEQKRAIEVIARNVKVQVSLIDDMLDLSRVVRGAVELRRDSIDVAALVTAAVDGMRPAAAEKQLCIELKIDPIESRTTGDGDRLIQVMSNLLSNAVKFTPPGGRITVSLKRGLWRSERAARGRENWQECVRITVADTGSGIPAEEVGRVFERFWRGRNAPARQIGGLGLGLAIARRLVEMHDGDIWVENGAEGVGATFTIELPLERTPTRPARGPGDGTHRAQRADLHGVRILLVDDDPEALEIVTRELVPLGATVTAVSSAREAYERIQELRPDLLVSDLAMPDEDGLSLIQRIRKLPSERGGVTPAVALTAWAGAGDEGRVIEAGFQRFVAKPVDAERLRELIGSMVGGSKRAS